MLNPMFTQVLLHWFVAEVRATISYDRSRNTKPTHNLFLEESDYSLAIIFHNCHGFDTLGDIFDC